MKNGDSPRVRFLQLWKRRRVFKAFSFPPKMRRKRRGDTPAGGQVVKSEVLQFGLPSHSLSPFSLPYHFVLFGTRHTGERARSHVENIPSVLS